MDLEPLRALTMARIALTIAFQERCKGLRPFISDYRLRNFDDSGDNGGSVIASFALALAMTGTNRSFNDEAPAGPAQARFSVANIRRIIEPRPLLLEANRLVR